MNPSTVETDFSLVEKEVLAHYAAGQAAIVAEIRDAVIALEPSLRPERSCLLSALLGAVLLQRRGQHAVLQAGSAYWHYKAEDDGGTTHYSYVFDPKHPRSAQRLAEGRLPEVHCWIGLPRDKEIIDITTRHLPALVQEALNVPWTTPQPPDFFWGNMEDLPAGWHYDCTVPAIETVLKLAFNYWPELVREHLQLRNKVARS